MSVPSASGKARLLVYEPRVEGHHPGWLRFLTEDLLSADYDLTLAVDLRPGSRAIIEEHLGDLVTAVTLLPALDEAGKPRGGSTAQSLVLGLQESGAAGAFMGALDELASRAFRRAALGLRPPTALRGRIGGIFHRPRFTIAPWWSPNGWLKRIGFRRLMKEDWIRPLLMVDEYLAREFQENFAGKPVFFLPDPCPDGFTGDPAQAREELGVPADRTVFLFFGVGARRKGLHVAVDAMFQLADPSTFLLVAGKQDLSPHTKRGLDRLEQEGRAKVLDRYVSSQEESLCFQAADCVLLPYLNHFGTSGVLSRAMAAGRPVIVTDEQLLGRLVRDNVLGWLFPRGEIGTLVRCLASAARMDDASRKRFAANAANYAHRYSRAAYREALLTSLEVG